jgi:hypothetical protein
MAKECVKKGYQVSVKPKSDIMIGPGLGGGAAIPAFSMPLSCFI